MRVFRRQPKGAPPEEPPEVKHEPPSPPGGSRRLYLVLLGLSLLLNVAALTWLAWLSPPRHWFSPKQGEARVAIPVDRLAPPVRIRQIRSDLDFFETRISDLESLAGSSDLEGLVSDLEAQVEDATSRLDDMESQTQDLDSRMSDSESRLDDLENEVSGLCTTLSVELTDIFLICP